MYASGPNWEERRVYAHDMHTVPPSVLLALYDSMGQELSGGPLVWVEINNRNDSQRTEIMKKVQQLIAYLKDWRI